MAGLRTASLRRAARFGVDRVSPVSLASVELRTASRRKVSRHRAGVLSRASAAAPRGVPHRVSLPRGVPPRVVR